LLEDFHIRREKDEWPEGVQQVPPPSMTGEEPGSGGLGKYSAGNGTIRTIRFLEKMDCAILSSHRKIRPHGLLGGEPGELGATFVRRKDGRMEELKGADQTVLEAGEAVIVKTPTGGGYGKME
jgi:5-oxoprolinase (ATP-hydrolysing)